MKSTQIMVEQYLWDQLDTHIITDPLEDILKQLDKQTHSNHTCTQSKQVNNTQDGTYINNMPHENITPNKREDINQTKREVNNKQKVSDNNIPFHKNTKKNSEGSDVNIRIRYGRIVRKPNRLMYLTHCSHRQYTYTNIIIIILFC